MFITTIHLTNNKNSLRTARCTGLIFVAILLFSPAGLLRAQSLYYQKADGKSGKELKTALHQIIRMPDVIDYDSLWHAYQMTDARPMGDSLIIWDMYSAVSRYSIYSKLHGNGKVEGEKGFQREHSMPKSWFNPTDRTASGTLTYKDIKPMYSDIVHVIPTDGTVNNKRSNNAYGEVSDSAKMEWISAEGFSKQSKKGGCTTPGWQEYLGDEAKKSRVFEPNDEYKGDLARIYFYMATCYEDTIDTWTSPMLDSLRTGGYQPFAPWAFDMLMRWSKQDPVSEKEINRNEVCYRLQGNRNPFVDYPGLEDYIWGDKQEEPFDYGGEPMGEEPMAADCEIALNSSAFGVDWTATDNLRDYFERIPLTYSQDGVDVTFAYGIEGSQMYCDEGQIRLYNRNTLTFLAHKNEMTCIEFDVPEKSADKELIPSVGEVEGNTWTGQAREVQFTSTYTSGYPAALYRSKHIQIAGVRITMAESSGIVATLTNGETVNSAIYDLQGRRMNNSSLFTLHSSLTPGIYIRNGKKIIIR